MVVFVVTSHLEYEDNTPETWVEGVFDSLEKAQKVMEEVFEKQLELNWGSVDEEEREYKKGNTRMSVFNTSNNFDYACIEIWTREIE